MTKSYELSEQSGIELDIIDPTVNTIHAKQANEEQIDKETNGYVESESYTMKCTCFYKEYRQQFVTARNCILLLLYLGYYGYAMHCNFGDEASIRLTVFTALGLGYISWNRLLSHKSIENAWKSFLRAIRTFYSHGRRTKVIRWYVCSYRLCLP